MRIPASWARCASSGVLAFGVAGSGLGCAWVDSIFWRPPPDPVPVTGRPPIATPIAAGKAASGRAVHVVHFGDTLWDISRSHGVAVEELAQANGIADADRIEVGQRLVIPASASAPAAGASAARSEASLKRAHADLDGRLRAAEDLVRTARFQEAIGETDRARAALGRLEAGGVADAREQRVRLELLSGTAYLAVGRDDAATRSFERALAADPDLALDPARFSPKIVRRFEEIRTRVSSNERAGPEQVAGRDTAP